MISTLAHSVVNPGNNRCCGVAGRTAWDTGMSVDNRTKDDPRNKPGRMSRRSLLKGTVVSMPAILTLQSGAALARSSNMISASNFASPDSRGRTLCLDVSSVYPADSSGKRFDLGDPAHAEVTAIPERDYRIEPRKKAAEVMEEQMCLDGKTYYYRDSNTSWDSSWTSDDDDDDGTLYSLGRWRQVDVPRGVLVSATALHSFAQDIVINEI